MILTKVYDPTCDVCKMLAGLDDQIAEDNGFYLRKMTLTEVAQDETELAAYFINVYVNPNDGMVDLPTYLISTPGGDIQASGVVKTVAELNNMIDAWKKWESSLK